MEPAPTPPPAAAVPPRFHLRVEDIVLFLWLVLRPLIVPNASQDRGVPGFDPIGGLFDLVGLCTAAACIGARRADGTHSGFVVNGDVSGIVGPLFGAVAFALTDCVERLGLSGGLESVPLILPIGTAVVARFRLPPTTAVQRRALVTPFIIAASGFFSDFISRLSDLFDLRVVAAWLGGDTTGLAAFGAVLAILGVLVFYAMLVFAPRQIAEREGGALTWTVRFVTFILGLTLGTTLAGIVHGT
jgi:hypothetical protein